MRGYRTLALAIPSAITDYVGRDLNVIIDNAKIDEDFSEFVKSTKKEDKVEVIEYTPIKVFIFSFLLIIIIIITR